MLEQLKKLKMLKEFLHLLEKLNYIDIYIIYNNTVTILSIVTTTQLSILLFV